MFYSLIKYSKIIISSAYFVSVDQGGWLGMIRHFLYVLAPSRYMWFKEVQWPAMGLYCTLDRFKVG